MSTVFHTHDEYIKNRQSCRPGSVKWFLLKGKYAICKYVVYVCVNFSLPSFLSVNWNSPRALTRSEVKSYMKSDMARLGWNHKCKCVIYAYRRHSLFEQFGHKFGEGGKKQKDSFRNRSRWMSFSSSVVWLGFSKHSKAIAAESECVSTYSGC